jgi:hypothetical protein
VPQTECQETPAFTPQCAKAEAKPSRWVGTPKTYRVRRGY